MTCRERLLRATRRRQRAATPAALLPHVRAGDVMMRAARRKEEAGARKEAVRHE